MTSQVIMGEIQERLEAHLCNELSDRRPWCGVRWSPNQPTDGTCDEILVVDADDVEYTVEVDVWVYPSGTAVQRDG